jgi:hypothetical protein
MDEISHWMKFAPRMGCENQNLLRQTRATNEPATAHQRTIHWMCVIITHLVDEPQLELIFWFHLGNQFCGK